MSWLINLRNVRSHIISYWIPADVGLCWSVADMLAIFENVDIDIDIEILAAKAAQ